MKIKYTILIILLILQLYHSQDEKVIKFGGNLHKLSDFYFDLMFVPVVESCYHFFEYWVKENVELKINGEEYDFEFIILEDDRYGVEENYRKLFDERNITIAVNVGSIESAETSAELANERGMPILVITPSPGVYKNKTTAFNIYPNPYSQLYDILPHLRVAGVKSIHVLEMTNSTKACYNNDEIFEINFIDDVVTTVYSEHGDEFYKAIDKVIELDKDLLLYCDMNQTNYNELTRILYERNYTPRAGLNLMLDKFMLNTTYTDYWMMYQVLPDGLQHPETKYFKTFDNLKKEMEKFYKLHPEYKIDVDQWKDNILTIITKLELALHAILTSNSLDKDVLVDTIRRSKYDSLMGKISFSSDNAHLISGIGYQIINNTTKNILLPSTLSNSSIIYPMPTYEERVKSSKLKEIEIIVTSFVVLMVINSVGWIIFVIAHQKNENLRASSPIFLVGMLVGSIIVYLSLFTWFPTIINDITCILLPWLMSIGFTLLFGSMLVKTWRIHLIFSKKTLTVFKVGNRKVMLFLSILLLIDIFLLSLWTGLSKTKSKEFIVDEHRISKNYNVCNSNTAGKVFIWVIVVYKILQIIYGGYLALRVRTIPMKTYDESKIIAFCIYNVGLSSIIIGILQATNPTGRYIIFGINSFLIILSTCITINSMMITKFRHLKKNKSSSSTHGTHNSSITLSTITEINARDDIENQIEKLRKENKKLKAKVRKLKEKLEELQQKSEDVDQESV